MAPVTTTMYLSLTARSGFLKKICFIGKGVNIRKSQHFVRFRYISIAKHILDISPNFCRNQIVTNFVASKNETNVVATKNVTNFVATKNVTNFVATKM